MLDQLAPGVYAYVQDDGSWFINNTGVIAGDGEVVCIDSCATEARTRSYLDAVRSVTHWPIEILVNTHHHPDHTNGNGMLGARSIVAHSACRTELARAPGPPPPGVFEPVQWGDVDASLPTICINDRAELFMAGQRIELLHPGVPAHTTNDVVVWLPHERVLFAGDLAWAGATPFALSGSINGWLDALEGLQKLSPAIVVPGHGPVGGMELLAQTRDYLEFVRRAAAPAHAARLTALEAARVIDLGPYAELSDRERIVGNLERAFAELDALPLGSPLDHAAAFAAMVEWGGGGPLRCVA